MKKPTVALVTGCFDLLHYGHLSFFQFARSQADTLVVALESDQYLRDHKGPSRPLFSQKERLYCLQQIKTVSQVIPLDDSPNYIKLLQKTKADCLVISSNDSNYNEKYRICQKFGVRLVVFPRLKKFSTSKITVSDIPGLR